MSLILFSFDDEQVLEVGAIASAEAFGEPLLANPLELDGIASAEAFGEPTIYTAPRPAPRPVPHVPAASGGPFFFFGTGGGGGAAWSRYALLRRDVMHVGLGAETFEWPKAAEKDEARRALRKVASWMHPDVVARLHPEARAQLEERFSDLTEAYSALSRREAATRSRTLTAPTIDPAWEEFLRSLRPAPGALVPEELATRLSEVAEVVNAAETIEDVLAPKKRKKRKRKKPSPTLVTYALPPLPLAVVDMGPLISDQTVATAAFLVASFGAGWFIARTIDRALASAQS